MWVRKVLISTNIITTPIKFRNLLKMKRHGLPVAGKVRKLAKKCKRGVN